MSVTQSNSISINRSRNYGIDALRIISMLMIVAIHILGYGGLLANAKSTNYWIVSFLRIACWCAVNCYALISGYVGVYTKYKISNLAVLWCTVAFYTVSITVFCKAFFWDSVSTREFISAFFPILSKNYWYFTAYALLFFFIPILNKGLAALTKKQMGFILIAIITAISVLRPVVNIVWGDVFALGEGHCAWWLMILYLIGGYIRKYGLFGKIKTHRTPIFFSLYFAVIAFTWIVKFALHHITIKIFGEARYEDFLINYTSIAILAAGVFLLLAVENMQLHKVSVKVIAFLSPLTFSVYIIHMQPQILKRFIEHKFVWLIHLPAYKMLPLLIACILGIYLLCSIIDLARHYLFKAIKLKGKFERLESKIKNRISSKIISKII